MEFSTVFTNKRYLEKFLNLKDEIKSGVVTSNVKEIINIIQRMKMKVRHPAKLIWYALYFPEDSGCEGGELWEDRASRIEKYCEENDIKLNIGGAWFMSWFENIYDVTLTPERFTEGMLKVKEEGLESLDGAVTSTFGYKIDDEYCTSRMQHYFEEIPFEWCNFDCTPHDCDKYITILVNAFGVNTVYEPMYSNDETYNQLKIVFKDNLRLLAQLFIAYLNEKDEYYEYEFRLLNWLIYEFTHFNEYHPRYTRKQINDIVCKLKECVSLIV